MSRLVGAKLFGDDLEELPKHADFADKSYYDTGDVFAAYADPVLDEGFERMAPVGNFAPNP